MTSNLAPQDSYATSALMQLGGPANNSSHMPNGNIGEGGIGPMNGSAILGTSIPMTDVNGAHAAIMAMAHMHGSGNNSVESQGLGTGVQWPLNIFETGHGDS